MCLSVISCHQKNRKFRTSKNSIFLHQAAIDMAGEPVKRLRPPQPTERTRHRAALRTFQKSAEDALDLVTDPALSQALQRMLS